MKYLALHNFQGAFGKFSDQLINSLYINETTYVTNITYPKLAWSAFWMTIIFIASLTIILF